MRRYIFHFLPKRFVKLRSFGIFCGSIKKKRFEILRKVLNVTENKCNEEEIEKKNIKCSNCGSSDVDKLYEIKPRLASLVNNRKMKVHIADPPATIVQPRIAAICQ